MTASQCRTSVGVAVLTTAVVELSKWVPDPKRTGLGGIGFFKTGSKNLYCNMDSKITT